MPCCGLSEYRRKVPIKYTVIGMILFWGIYSMSFVTGILMSWNKLGRGVLKAQFEFSKVLWKETMRQHDSTPAKWSCRLSGYLLPISPAFAGIIFHHPEFPLFAIIIVIGFIIAEIVTISF